ncbi:ABC-2 transporter permease [Clostridium perfringens]|nr:ABC-2 transporter permease [Clostridium perfringens]MDK0712376.1 ABC-2 transporter permease [Clostridium perfringens]
MKELIKLDFFIQKKYIKSLLIMFIFLLVIFSVNGKIENSLYSLGLFVVFYLVIVPIELEKRNKFNLCLNSIPIRKRDYIMAKYISSILYLVIVNILITLVCLIISLILTNSNEINFSMVLMFVAFELIYVAVIEPLYIFMNYKYYRIINIITVIISITLGEALFKILKNIIELTNNNKYIILLIVGLISIIISFLITLFFYKRSEVK